MTARCRCSITCGGVHTRPLLLKGVPDGGLHACCPQGRTRLDTCFGRSIVKYDTAGKRQSMMQCSKHGWPLGTRSHCIVVVDAPCAGLCSMCSYTKKILLLYQG